MSFIKKIFNVQDRYNRKKYIIAQINIFLLAIISMGIFFACSMLNNDIAIIISGILVFILFVLMICYGITLGIRRLKDLDKEWYFLFLVFLPILNFVLPIFLLFAKGTEGDNRFGPDPLA